MPRVDYVNDDWKPRAATKEMIANANAICAEYQAQGFDLTLRQLYYQFVGRQLLPNTQQNYDRLGQTLVKAREHGMMDWAYLVDRGRNMQSVPHWETPEDILDTVARQFAVDKWAAQENYVEVWVEKEAQIGTIGRIARGLDVPWYACKGYNSSSELWAAAMRLVAHLRDSQDVTVVYLGDHDPSGLQMVEDIRGRLEMFCKRHVGYSIVSRHLHINRVALNIDQIEERNLPPNPAKETDSRYQGYVEETGLTESWELDALDPNDVMGFVREAVMALRDEDAWNDAKAQEALHRATLRGVKSRFPELVGYMNHHAWIEAQEEDDDGDEADAE